MDEKRSLEQFQLSLWKLLSAEEEGWCGQSAPDVSTYAREYQESLSGPAEPASLRELARALSRSDVVYVGDDHALPSSREAFLDLLQRSLRHRKNLAIGLEMFHAEDQATLDRYLAGKITEKELLTATRYWERWGFDWQSYHEILLLAREWGLPILALNSDPSGEDRLTHRDRAAAQTISSFVQNHPGRPLFVLFGEQHVSENHLPREVEHRLRREGTACRWLIIHQHPTMERLDAAAHPAPRLLQLNEKSYLWTNTSPLAALSSHLDWFELGSRKGRPLDRESLRANLLDRIHTVALAFSVMLEMDEVTLDNFELFLEGEDATALEAARAAGLGETECDRLAWEFRQLPVTSIPGTPYLFLKDPTFQGACEAAGWLLARGDNQSFQDREPLLSFATRSFRHGLGYFVSKLFDPYRSPTSLRQWIGRTSLPRESHLADWRRDFREFLADPSRLGRFAQRLESLPTDQHAIVSRSTGEIFGTKLFQYFTRGMTNPGELRQVFLAARGPGEGLLSSYFSFLRRGPLSPTAKKRHSS